MGLGRENGSDPLGNVGAGGLGGDHGAQRSNVRGPEGFWDRLMIHKVRPWPGKGDRMTIGQGDGFFRQVAGSLGIGRKAAEFKNVVALAEEALQRDPALLIDLVRLLGRGLQAHRLSLALKAHGDVDDLPGVSYEQVWFSEVEPITPEGESLFSLQGRRIRVDQKHVVRLGRDLVLPLAWKRERLLDSLRCIGPERLWGPWKQDPYNHRVELWLPMRVAWVCGGNHSITAGIARGEGEIETRSVYDFAEMYEHVECDGKSFKRKHDGKVLSRVKSVEWAAIFEIGRLLVEDRQGAAITESPL